jgi:hypothetical protein
MQSKINETNISYFSSFFLLLFFDSHKKINFFENVFKEDMKRGSH